MDDKMKKIIFIVLGGFVLLFLFLFLLSSCSKKISVENLENVIIKNSQKYYDMNKEELPSKNSGITLSLNDLVNKGIIKELDKSLEKNATCSGTLTIENNNEIIYLDMKDNKLIDFNENKIDLSIYELFELLLDAWEKDNLLYEIKKELGLFTCSCNFTTKNNQKISIYGYANRKELALNDCDKHIAILKEIFRKGSESK